MRGACDETDEGRYAPGTIRPQYLPALRHSVGMGAAVDWAGGITGIVPAMFMAGLGAVRGGGHGHWTLI